MSNSLPLSLVVSWVLFFGFVNTHQRQAINFKGSSRSFHSILYISIGLGSLVGLGLLFFYFLNVSWYWPVVLFVGGSIIGGIIFGLLDCLIGSLGISLVSFIGWPAATLWTFYIIQGLR